MRALLRRLLVAAATLALVSALVFVVVDALADRATLELGRGAAPEALAARRALLGLDRPYLIRLLEHVGSAMSFQLGESGHEPVTARLWRALAPTLAYALPGFALASVLALGGGFAAARRRGWLDRGLLGLATALMSTSSVILVVLGQHLLAHRLRLFPVLGWPLGGDPRGALVFVLLPALLWALIQLGPDLRHYRALFIRELAAPHVEGLRARGLSEARACDTRACGAGRRPRCEHTGQAQCERRLRRGWSLASSGTSGITKAGLQRGCGPAVSGALGVEIRR